MQLPHQTDCTDREYVSTEGWKGAPRPEKCPLADKCKGRIQGHGTYARQTPEGMRVRRWLVEKSISEQLAFFHLNRLSSSMVIKVDFDLAMTVTAYNLYRLLALDLPPGHSHMTARTLFERMLSTGATVRLGADTCLVTLRKKRNLPALLETLQPRKPVRIPWIGNRRIVYEGDTRS